MSEFRKLEGELTRRRTRHGEHRLAPTLAVLAALVLYALTPPSLLFTPRWLIPGIEVILLVVLIATNPTRLTRETPWSRVGSMVLALLVIGSTLVSLALLIGTLSRSTRSPDNLLLGAMGIWMTNVIGFALLYWELDRGGPVARHEQARDALNPADWRFPQDENDGTVVEVSRGSSKESGWIPVFVDYFYLSLTNSSAFSPTDTMPLTSRAKLLMSLQGTAAMLTTLLLVARAVNAL